MLAGKRRTRSGLGRVPPEVKAAYGEIEGGLRGLGRSIAEIQKGFRKAEGKIEADARARVRALRKEARLQLGVLQSRQREASRTLKNLTTAAEGSWREVKHSADSILADARSVAASVIERFRSALGA